MTAWYSVQLHDSLVRAKSIRAVPGERDLLWAAAMAHDVGVAVAYDGRAAHAHSWCSTPTCRASGQVVGAAFAAVGRVLRLDLDGDDGLASWRLVRHVGDDQFRRIFRRRLEVSAPSAL